MERRKSVIFGNTLTTTGASWAWLCGGLVTMALVVEPTMAQDADEPAELEALEAQLAAEREKLGRVQANREDNQARVDEVREKLDAQERRQQELMDQLKTLCEEREALKPGSLDECMNEATG